MNFNYQSEGGKKSLDSETSRKIWTVLGIGILCLYIISIFYYAYVLGTDWGGTNLDYIKALVAAPFYAFGEFLITFAAPTAQILAVTAIV